MSDLAGMMAANQARVNARLEAEGRCIMHNSDVVVAAEYLLEVKIGNILPLCGPCCDQWRLDANDDPAMEPVSMKPVRSQDTPASS